MKKWIFYEISPVLKFLLNIECCGHASFAKLQVLDNGPGTAPSFVAAYALATALELVHLHYQSGQKAGLSRKSISSCERVLGPEC